MRRQLVHDAFSRSHIGSTQKIEIVSPASNWPFSLVFSHISSYRLTSHQWPSTFRSCLSILYFPHLSSTTVLWNQSDRAVDSNFSRGQQNNQGQSFQGQPRVKANVGRSNTIIVAMMNRSSNPLTILPHADRSAGHMDWCRSYARLIHRKAIVQWTSCLCRCRFQTSLWAGAYRGSTRFLTCVSITPHVIDIGWTCVRPSVTRWYCVETAQPIYRQTVFTAW